MKRREFSRGQKGEMLQRSRDANGRIRCEGCGMDLTGKRFDFDHTVAEAMRLEDDKGRPISIADGKLLGKACCHDPKSHEEDFPAVAKAKRRTEKVYGFKAPSRRPMPFGKGHRLKAKIGGGFVNRATGEPA